MADVQCVSCKMADVQCVSCNEFFHETTDAYNPDVAPNGSMFRLKDKYRNNGWSSFPEDTSTIQDNLYCPECGGGYCEGNPARVRVVGWVKPKVEVNRQPSQNEIMDAMLAEYDPQPPKVVKVASGRKGGRPRKV